MQNNHFVGDAYEKAAAFYLEHLGYKILKTNFRCSFGEIDIIAKEGGYLVFIEVKFRKNSQRGFPQEAVGFRKQLRICRAARYYMCCNGSPLDTPCRFDVVSILGKDIHLIKNAFEYIE